MVLLGGGDRILLFISISPAHKERYLITLQLRRNSKLSFHRNRVTNQLNRHGHGRS